MKIRALGIAGVGAVGLAAVGIASPATAAVEPGCGEVPAGASAAVSNGICQLDFDTTGLYNWTLPAGVSGLFALLVGAGGGAYADGLQTGYAGSGGSVIYVDYSSSTGGQTAEIFVGEAGATGISSPTDGGDTTVTLGAAVVADGGAGGDFLEGFCVADGNFSTFVGTGAGAGGPSPSTGADCATNFGAGVNPSLGDPDSDGTAVPTAFATLNATFGTGGRVVVSPAGLTPDLTGTGEGASVRYVAPNTVPASNARGGGGLVVFRYALPQAVLAATGQPIAPQLGIAAAVGALGAAMFVFSRRRTRADS